MAAFVRHEPCPACGSRNNLARYADGSAHCFGCAHYEHGTGEVQHMEQERPQYAVPFVDLGPWELVKRGITRDTCERWRYHVGELDGGPVQLAHYIRDGQIYATKIRFPNKDFTVSGDSKAMGFYGQWRHKEGGKKLFVTEGEIDCLSLSQALNDKWPVVSLPNGAQGASKVFKRELEWLESFEEVVLCFDMDEPGQEAAKECADILSPGKARIVHLPLKDANEMLKANRTPELLDAVWGAKEYRPDGIVAGTDITFEELIETKVEAFTTPYPLLNEKIVGIRKGELTLVCAGTGVGKSTLVRELGYHLTVNHHLTVGNIFLEESYAKTALGYVAIDLGVPLGILRANLTGNTLAPPEAIQASLQRVVQSGRLFFFDHFGSLSGKNLLSKLRFYAKGIDCDFIILDHISIVVSGQESSREGERKDIDILMTRLRSLIEETGVGVIAITHLKHSPEGRSHELGGQVTLDDLRGSGTLKQIPDLIIAGERNQQDEDKQNVMTLRVLKNREHGGTGLAGKLEYSPFTGRLLPLTLDKAEKPKAKWAPPVAGNTNSPDEGLVF